ncbi:FAD-dependent thymidylate synthase [Streptomyces smyrnaeus]|uniref:FAD-dependent thymidylate synthase n=1 Tax=Streptomyces smyrnaeus TaxID=1387713 RepID=UPI00368CF8C2
MPWAMVEATDGAYNPEVVVSADRYNEYIETADCDTVPVFAGRACYQSWGRPNPETRTEIGYLGNIIAQNHESVLEHSSATFYITGVSRNLTHELVRHRHLSFSEMSQRYVNMEDKDIVIPPALRAEHGEASYARLPFAPTRDYDATVKRLMQAGHSRKAAREAARYILPGGTETRIVVTGDMRAWRDFLKKRWHVAADAEIRELARSVLKQLKAIAPGCFQDFDPSTPLGGDN